LAKPLHQIAILIGNVVNAVEQSKLQLHLKNAQPVEKFVILKMSPAILPNVAAQEILTQNFDNLLGLILPNHGINVGSKI